MPDCLQVHITAPVPSIAVLALYRWLQDAHNTLQAGASAFPELQVLLLIKCWTTVASPQSPMGQQGTDPTFRAPSISPEASSSGPGSAHVDPETSTSPAGAGSTSPEASSFVPGPATISLEPAATSPSTAATSSGAVAISPGPAESSLAIAATSSVPGASSRVADTRSPLAVTNSPGSAATSPALEVRTAPRQRKGSSAGKQKQAASSLPAVAVKVFGPEYDDALIQDAIVRMVKGCGLPFR